MIQVDLKAIEQRLAKNEHTPKDVRDLIEEARRLDEVIARMRETYRIER